MRGLTDAQRAALIASVADDELACARALLACTRDEVADAYRRIDEFGAERSWESFMLRVDAAARAAGLWPVKS